MLDRSIRFGILVALLSTGALMGPRALCGVADVASSAPGILCGTATVAPVAEYTVSLPNMNDRPHALGALSWGMANTAGNVLSNADSLISVGIPRHSYTTAKSRFCSRDIEVETPSSFGLVLLRLTEDGSAVYFFEDTNNDLQIGIIKHYIERQELWLPEDGFGIMHQLYSIPLSKLPGLGDTTKADKFIFGVSGFDTYAKYNGVEFARFKDYRHVKTGRAAIQVRDTDQSRKITVRNLAAATLFSNPDATIIDMRDWGLQAWLTTGSISASTNQLMLLSNPGFKAGDGVIVETGGETGKGAYGTIGVGGYWPGFTYPSLKAMQADTSRPNGSFAAVPSGEVYVSWNGSWGKDGRYYFQKVSPWALVAKVTAVSEDGRTLTLDKAASVTSTDAKVYYDNTPVFDRIGRDQTAYVAPSVTISVPPGDFALGDGFAISRKPGWTLAGAGQNLTHFFAPKGANAFIAWSQSPNGIVRDLHLENSFGDTGYRLGGNFSGWFPSGLEFQSSDNSVAQDIRTSNIWFKAVGAAYSQNVWAYRIHNYLTVPMRSYLQWQYQWSDSRNGGCIDCTLDSAYLTAGYEGFRSDGIQFIRPVSVNGAFAMNTAGNFLIQDAHITIKPMSQFGGDDLSWHHLNPLININSNLDPSSALNSLGGRIVNLTLIQESYVNDRNDTLKSIVVNARNPNIIIQGGYIQTPDYKGPSEIYAGSGVISTAQNVKVDGLRVVGGGIGNRGYPGANIYLAHGTLKSCVADMWKVDVGTVINCMTNAQFTGKPALQRTRRSAD